MYTYVLIEANAIAIKKLELPWLGPYVITKKLSDVVYRMVNNRRAMVIHHDQLKPYKYEYIPIWARKVQQSLHREN